jgi:polyphosphate glucokinase
MERISRATDPSTCLAQPDLDQAIGTVGYQLVREAIRRSIRLGALTLADMPESIVSPGAGEYAHIPSPNARLHGHALGIDIGGTGIKAGVVDLATGGLVTPRIRMPTPKPAGPAAVVDVVAAVVSQVDATGFLTADMPAGAGFPSAIRAGRALAAMHGDASWIGVSVQELLEQRLGRPIQVLNDSDAAGIGEVAYGAGKDRSGVTLVLDLGTGIGSALLVHGELVPNVQLGHLEFRGKDAETRLAPVARLKRNMSWPTWGREFNLLLARYEACLWPDLIVLGGGSAKDFAKYEAFLKTKAPLVVAALGNSAGIVGAARVAGGGPSAAKPRGTIGPR